MTWNISLLQCLQTISVLLYILKDMFTQNDNLIIIYSPINWFKVGSPQNHSGASKHYNRITPDDLYGAILYFIPPSKCLVDYE